MKKFLLAAFVAITFVIYSLHQRKEGGAAVVAPSQGPSPAPSSDSATSDSGSSSSTPAAATGKYKDGRYTGNAADAYYGYIQVAATVSGGRITDIEFLQTPNDRGESVRINSQATPYLKQEAIQAQSAKVDIVSGATDTSQAFIESLGSALSKAQS